jgi:hypothetical protein
LTYWDGDQNPTLIKPPQDFDEKMPVEILLLQLESYLSKFVPENEWFGTV